MKIITISREFGSGGRELGKRLADELGFAYFDREILSAIAEKSNLNEGYIEKVLEEGNIQGFPFSFGRTFTSPVYMQQSTTQLLVLQQQIIKELAAQRNCVIVGRNADEILREAHPFNLFVYADMPSKISRCKERAFAYESLSDHEIQKKIKQIDSGRAKFCELCTNKKWGAKENYHLCVNTTGLSIKRIIPFIASYINDWFEGRD